VIDKPVGAAHFVGDIVDRRGVIAVQSEKPQRGLQDFLAAGFLEF